MHFEFQPSVREICYGAAIFGLRLGLLATFHGPLALPINFSSWPGSGQVRRAEASLAPSGSVQRPPPKKKGRKMPMSGSSLRGPWRLRQSDAVHIPGRHPRHRAQSRPRCRYGDRCFLPGCVYAHSDVEDRERGIAQVRLLADYRAAQVAGPMARRVFGSVATLSSLAQMWMRRV